MTDRELLEAAAKAYGLDVTWNDDFQGFEYPIMFRQALTNWERWNPLEDDGDALRLAVKLNLDITFDCYAEGPVVEVTQQWGDIKSGSFEYLDTRLGAETATRRAIVRAAASIGEKL